MNRITQVFAQLKQADRPGLIPFITAGDPDLATSLVLVRTLVAAGADVIELGFPFSDPMADGPTIQAASERALAAGTSLAGVLSLVAEVRRESQVPIVLMGYFNPVYRYGVERFAVDAAAAGVDGLLLVDLPPEEADEVLPALKLHGIDIITLLAPTTPPERMKRLAELGSGYLYYVSMTGVTGSKKLDPEEIRQAVTEVRKLSPIPVGVGFGITTAEDAAIVGSYADAVVVGSALVKVIADHAHQPDLQQQVHRFITDLRQGLENCR
ncbi:tryptophan synthase subunit alpha [Geopsychrobacter electrodiphilus]|uniref:tryptophan synthase subunit alpha n=1 Tax=Geopsychrobacter electrodiphilus TaxID=225196 RepID=UPI00038055AB|nr:tryptophan synthase subunit alpha [Geopsychrobacter electrodiphilus]